MEYKPFINTNVLSIIVRSIILGNKHAVLLKHSITKTLYFYSVKNLVNSTFQGKLYNIRLKLIVALVAFGKHSGFLNDSIET